MIIITKFPTNITEYAKLGKENLFPTISGCKHCGFGGNLHRHCFYERNAITPYEVFRIVILRVKCPSCHKTHSIIPSFLIPYRQYTFEHIFLCLSYLYTRGYSYLSVLRVFRGLNPHTFFSIANVNHFKRRMIEVTPLVNYFFANFSDLYFDMAGCDTSSVGRKMGLYISAHADFNLEYGSKMPIYFFKKVS